MQNGKLLIWIVTCKPQSKMQGSMTESTASTATSKSRMSPQPDVEATSNVQDSPTEEFIDKLADDMKGLGAEGDTSSSLSDSYDTTLSSSDEILKKLSTRTMA